MSNRIYMAILAASCVLVLQCGLFEPREDKGSIAIAIQNEDSMRLAKPLETLSSVRYILKQESSAVRDGYLLRNGDYFQCTITGVESGRYSVDVLGYDSKGDLVCTGRSGSISVSAGQKSTAELSWVPTRGVLDDIDGKLYHVVIIGTQIWTVENLRVTRYRNGDPIPNISNYNSWSSLTTGAYCNYENDTSYVATYGRLYNWYAVADGRNIAPSGWHVSTDADWKTLINYLGKSSVAGGKLKETGTSHWNSPNIGATNISGFSALPGGVRYFRDGIFLDLGVAAAFWSKDVTLWYLSFDNTEAKSNIYIQKQTGLSVRLVLDDE